MYSYSAVHFWGYCNCRILPNTRWITENNL